MENTRKRKHSPDATDEERDKRTSSLAGTGADPDTQSTSAQEPSTSAEGQPPAMDSPAAFECPICLGAAIRTGYVKHLQCSHEFHQSCVDKWVHNNKSCPLCRAPVRKKRPRKFQRYRRRYLYR
ncbi:hypothetical protein AVEN_90967-1 [Araneus ventricosus]|uniref:RING-type E3 ubiquitin transferase n=1 Tax=Araneus ventricosus TaxID=182803 RepID=A0A4Y2LN59_ARAVE|nr:hypothetical protein AVEN_90967-1 [Araneus ventricosus]